MQTLIAGRIQEAIRSIREIETRYGISIIARGSAYGGARLMIRDLETGETFDIEEGKYEASESETQEF